MKSKKLGTYFVVAMLMVSLVLSCGSMNAYAEENMGSWEKKANVSLARYRIGVTEANGKLYAIGGAYSSSNGTVFLKTVEEYDSETDTWTKKTDMPTARYTYVVTVNDKIYAIGGAGGTNGNYLKTVEEYDPATDTWTPKADMPTARSCLGAAVVNNKIYIIGGTNGNALKTVEEYDPATDTWTPKADMPTARYDVGTVAVNNKIYTIGGRNGEILKTVEEYDPITDTWMQKVDMPSERFTPVVEVNNKIYAIGGTRKVGTNVSEPTDIVEEYNPTTDTWVTKSNMPAARYCVGVAVLDGVIFVVGGRNGSAYVSTVEAFTPPIYPPNTPTNLIATANNAEIDLSWDSVDNAESYILKRATTSGGPYTTIAENILGTSYTDTDVTNGTTYYYVVCAVQNGATSPDSNEASATPEGSSSGDRALLKITMVNGTINEYDLSMTDVDDFIDWYEDRGDDRGKPYYIIEKDYNMGPFESRKDYLAFDKILQFEVMEYNK